MGFAAYEQFGGTEEELRALLAESDVPVVLAVTSADVPSCASESEVLQKTSDTIGPRARLLHVEASCCRGLLRECQLSSVPALLALENGRLVGQHVGRLEPGDVVHVLGLDLWRNAGDEKSVPGLF